MTAYEELSFREEGIATLPATPQSVWAHQVFEFVEALRQEITRFDEVSVAESGISEHYMDGHYDASEQLRNRFYEIFGVSESPAV